MATAIDTLKIAKSWRAAQSEDERAEVLATSLRELQQLQQGELATKADLAAAKAELKSEVALAEARLEGRIEAAQIAVLKWLVALLLAQAGLIVALLRLL